MATTQKVQVSQDFLFSYIQEHNVNVSEIARLMGVTQSVVNSSFLHHKNKQGKPRRFTSLLLPKLNEALSEMARQMQGSLIQFGSPQTFTNRVGTTYDPGTLPQLRALSRFFNLTQMMIRVLGWTELKKNATLSAPASKIYGHVSQDNVTRLNAELLAVAAVLERYEVVPDEDAYDSSSSD